MEIKLTLDDMSEMTLSSEQALFGLDLGIIYYCPEHRWYHNAPDTVPGEVIQALTAGAYA